MSRAATLDIPLPESQELLDDPNFEDTGVEEVTPQQPAETAAQKLARFEKQIGEQQQTIQTIQQQQPNFNQMLGDPDFQAFMAAKARGEKITFGQPQATQAAEPEVVDWNAISPEQLPAKIVEYTAREARRLAKEELAQGLAPIQQQQKAQNELAARQHAQAAQAEWKKLHTETKGEIDTYKGDMLATYNRITKDGPTLQELYLLARARNGAPAPADERRGTASERPNTPPSRPAQRSPRVNTGPTTDRGQRRAATANLLASQPVPEALR